jgi:hypothetical protein
MKQFSAQPAIIGFAGRKRSGKNTAAQTLVDHYQGLIQFEPLAFGSFVKGEIYAHCTTVRTLPSYWPADIRAILQRYFELPQEQIMESLVSKPTDPDARRLLQWWGTEYRRKEDPAYWIKMAARSIAPGKTILATDVRFLNEYQFLRALNGAVFYIDRPIPEDEQEEDRHSSETFDWLDVPKWRANCNGRYVIDNSSDVKNFQKNVISQTEAILWKRKAPRR